MTLYLVGHGNNSGNVVEVPAGTTVHVYAEDGDYLHKFTGMAVLSPGVEACTSRKQYTSADGGIALMPNYELQPLSSDELQHLVSVYDPGLTTVFVGDGIDPGRLCSGATCDGEVHVCAKAHGRSREADESCGRPSCWGGVHRCAGLFTRVRDTDIRLVCCLVPRNEIGLADITRDLPGRDIGFAAFEAEAERLAAALAGEGHLGPTMEWLRATERTDPARVAKLLNAGTKLLVAVYVASAREQLEAGMSPSGFTHWLGAIPEAHRLEVARALRANGIDPHPSAAGDGVGDFLRRFPVLDDDERADGWLALSEQDRVEVAEYREAGRWVERILPALGEIRAAADSADVARAWNAIAGMPELSEAEYGLTETESYRRCIEVADRFAALPPDERFSIWTSASEPARQQIESMYGFDPVAHRPGEPELARLLRLAHERQEAEDSAAEDSDADDSEEFSLGWDDDEQERVTEQNRTVLKAAIEQPGLPVYLRAGESGALVFDAEPGSGDLESFTVAYSGFTETIVRRSPFVETPLLHAAVAAAMPGWQFEFGDA
ncbi:hypothetical protein OG439_07905 [Amycolatopsis sp. NBC_01307]|uniref:putative adhesin n=1 Tax=Amycolatopsis sp. NBC_01307 TaxID=2903561 RepID=UPI002E14B61C|nr:hypothetical protein OG439_07905 [Amycolatopsis sp. NBC_01307]